MGAEVAGIAVVGAAVAGCVVGAAVGATVGTAVGVTVGRLRRILGMRRSPICAVVAQPSARPTKSATQQNDGSPFSTSCAEIKDKDLDNRLGILSRRRIWNVPCCQSAKTDRRAESRPWRAGRRPSQRQWSGRESKKINVIMKLRLSQSKSLISSST